jgi:hypothetical protein
MKPGVVQSLRSYNHDHPQAAAPPSAVMVIRRPRPQVLGECSEVANWGWRSSSWRRRVRSASGRCRRWPGCSPALPSLSLNSAGSVGQRQGKHGGHGGQHIGRPKSLDESKAALARRMHASGEPVTTIAATLGVSRATVYRTLAEQADGGESPSSNSPV